MEDYPPADATRGKNDERVVLVGNFGERNIGDEMICAAALEVYPEAVVLTSDEAYTKRFHGAHVRTLPMMPVGVRSVWKYVKSGSLRERYREVFSGTTKVVLPGGGLWAIRLKAYWIWTATVWWCRCLAPEARIEATHQGVDSVARWGVKGILLRLGLGGVDSITVRDKASQYMVEITCGKRVENEGDRVWDWLKWKEKESKKSDQEQSNKEACTLVQCREPMGPEAWQKLKAKYSGPYKVVRMARQDAGLAPEGIEEVVPGNVQEVLALYAGAKRVVAQRLHGVMIGAATAGREKTVLWGEPYSEKVESFVKRLEIQKMVT